MTGEHLPVEFHCVDVGVACRKVARANSEEELLSAVREHAREAHGVELDETLVDYARSRVRTAGEPARG